MVLLKELVEEAMEKHSCDRFGVACNNMSNKTGFKYVSRVNNKLYKQGYCWKYRRNLGGEVVQVQGISLKVLRERVISRGLPWVVTDEVLARSSFESECLN